jgi:hypothetical protein
MGMVLFDLGRLSQDWEILNYVVHVRQRAGDLQLKVEYGSDDAQFVSLKSRQGNSGRRCSRMAVRW